MLMDHVPPEAVTAISPILIIGLVILILKFAKTALAGFVAILVFGFIGIVIFAALPFMPTEPPEQFDISESDMRYIDQMQKEGRFDYEFGYNLFFGE
jgi:hypothetical protein